VSEALASGPPFLGPPFRSYAHKCSLFFMKNLLFILIMCYKVDHYQVICFQRDTSETVMCRYLALEGAPKATEMCKYLALKGAPNSNCNIEFLVF